MPRQAAANTHERQESDDLAVGAPEAKPARPAAKRKPAAPTRPARRLQEDVAAAAAAGAFGGQGEDRWSARQTLSFILVTCGAFWLAVGLMLSRLL